MLDKEEVILETLKEKDLASQTWSMDQKKIKNLSKRRMRLKNKKVNWRQSKSKRCSFQGLSFLDFETLILLRAHQVHHQEAITVVISIGRALAVDLSEAAKKVKRKKVQVKVPQMNVEMKITNKKNFLKTLLSISLSTRSKCPEFPSNANLKIQIMFWTNIQVRTPSKNK